VTTVKLHVTAAKYVKTCSQLQKKLQNMFCSYKTMKQGCLTRLCTEFWQVWRQRQFKSQFILTWHLSNIWLLSKISPQTLEVFKMICMNLELREARFDKCDVW